MLEFACGPNRRRKFVNKYSVAPTGMGDGSYDLWNEKDNGREWLHSKRKGKYCGLGITMLDAVKKMRELGFSDDEISKMASSNPAKLLGCFETRGSIEIGKRADLVALDNEGKCEDGNDRREVCDTA
jgi:N-acetylglucosamine-6-phosphate deacetylase